MIGIRAQNYTCEAVYSFLQANTRLAQNVRGDHRAYEAPTAESPRLTAHMLQITTLKKNKK